MNPGAYQFRGDTLPVTQAARAGGAVTRVDLTDVVNKADVLTLLCSRLHFAAGFGHNWDALSDSLSELTAPVMAFEHAGQLTGATAEMLADILADLSAKALGPSITVVCRAGRLKRLTTWPRL